MIRQHCRLIRLCGRTGAKSAVRRDTPHRIDCPRPQAVKARPKFVEFLYEPGLYWLPQRLLAFPHLGDAGKRDGLHWRLHLALEKGEMEIVATPPQPPAAARDSRLCLAINRESREFVNYSSPPQSPKSLIAKQNRHARLRHFLCLKRECV